MMGGKMMHVCTNQQTCQWTVKVSYNHGVKHNILLKAKPVKMALRILDVMTIDPPTLLRFEAYNMGSEMETVISLRGKLSHKFIM
jgi:hypothetical protein